MSNIEEAVYTAVGRRIKEVRESKQLSQEQLATKLKLGRTSITNIEKGKQRVMLHTLYQVASELQLEIGDLLPTLCDLSTRSFQVPPGQELSSVDHSWVEKVRQTARGMKEE